MINHSCNAYYEERDIDYNTIANETSTVLLDLKTCLLNADSNNKLPPVDLEKADNTFEYNSKVYHMNFVDELYSKVNAKGETPLHIACRKKKIEEVTQLIKKKVDLNIEDYAGWSPLHEAVESGSVEVVEVLLKHGAFIDIPGPEYVTPLHKAVNLENIHLVRLLLKYGANKNSVDYFGKNPVGCTTNQKIKNIFSEHFVYVERVEEIFCRKKICAYFYYVDKEFKDKLTKSQLVKTVKEFDEKKVTHFIMKKTHKPLLKILTAMLDGCFLVPQEWINDFLSGNYFIPIPNYTFISNAQLNKGIQEALLSSLMKLPRLFDGIFFYIYGHSVPVEIYNLKVTRESISSLILAGGGRILRRAPTPTISEGIENFPYHSNKRTKVTRCCYYIIYEAKNAPVLQYQMAEIKHKSSEWLVECVINFTIND